MLNNMRGKTPTPIVQIDGHGEGKHVMEAADYLGERLGF